MIVVIDALDRHDAIREPFWATTQSRAKRTSTDESGKRELIPGHTLLRLRVLDLRGLSFAARGI